MKGHDPKAQIHTLEIHQYGYRTDATFTLLEGFRNIRAIITGQVWS